MDEVYYYVDDVKTVLGTTDVNGKLENVTLPANENIRLYSSVANDPDNLSEYYSKEFTLNENTSFVYVMPNDNTVYWYGYKNDIQVCSPANGWSYTGSASFGQVVFNTNNVYVDSVGNYYSGITTIDKVHVTLAHAIIKGYRDGAYGYRIINTLQSAKSLYRYELSSNIAANDTVYKKVDIPTTSGNAEDAYFTIWNSGSDGYVYGMWYE